MKKGISLALALVLSTSLLGGCGGAKYKDGTYEGTGEGFGGDIKVEVEIKDEKISDVTVVENDETPEYAEEALKDLPATIVEKNSTDVDAVSGATNTSNGIIEAVNDALEQAK